jgi:hypothetical protein
LWNAARTFVLDVLTDRAPNLSGKGTIALLSKRCELLGRRAFAAKRDESLRLLHEQRRYTLLRMLQA